MMKLRNSDIMRAAKVLADICIQRKWTRLYPVPRGGVPVAYAIAGLIPGGEVVDSSVFAHVIIDDIVDSGTTRERYPSSPFLALVSKKIDFDAPIKASDWVSFPWEDESTQGAADVGIRLLQYIGEDPNREGLKETPKRFLKAWTEWTSGYKEDIASLFKDFGDGAENYDEMVIIDPIPFYSHCEHHLAAIFGTVHIAYIPNGRIAGLSKFCRLVDVFAKRLQVQERLTVQICESIVQALAPIGVGVVVKARHFCMESRGAKKAGVETKTIALRGAIKEDAAARAEFLGFVK